MWVYCLYICCFSINFRLHSLFYFRFDVRLIFSDFSSLILTHIAPICHVVYLTCWILFNLLTLLAALWFFITSSLIFINFSLMWVICLYICCFSINFRLHSFFYFCFDVHLIFSDFSSLILTYIAPLCHVVYLSCWILFNLLTLLSFSAWNITSM